MVNVTRYSVTHISVVVTLLVALLLGGVYAFWQLGKREDSTFTIKSAVVVAPYAGATPDEVERLVVEPLERELRTLSHLYEITSEAHFGYARLVVKLHPATPDERIPQLWDELRRKVDKARLLLPRDVGDISVADDFGDVYGLYYALRSEGGYSWQELRDYARDVERKLYAIAGVEKVMLYGEPKPEVDVWLSPATLAAFELRPEDIGRIISRQNDVVGLGVHRAGDISVELVEGTTYGSISELENQLLIAPDGKQYRLSDIATVERSYHTPRSIIMRVDGYDAIGVAVATDPQMDIVKVGNEVSMCIEQIGRQLPAGLDIVTLYPEDAIARQANKTFVLNLLESVAIVILLVMVVMGWRSGVIVGSSLIFSIAATLCAMLLLGEGINRTSLAGFIIAMGMLVDNAIVVTDNTTLLLRRGTPLRVAAIEGATSPRLALLIATLVAIISFLPLRLAPSSVAEIVAPLFIVVAVSLIMSWVFAITEVPVMSTWLLRGSNSVGRAHNMAWFGRIVETLVAHRWLTVTCVALLFLLSLWTMGRMPQNFFPQLAKSYFRADVILPEGYDVEATDARLRRMTEWLGSQSEVTRVSTTAGGTPPRYYLASSSYSERPNYGNILIEVADADDAPTVEERFDRWVSATMPDVWLRSSLFRLSPVPEATIEIGFVGDNIDTLSRLTSEAMAIMSERHDTRNVRNSWGNRVAVWQPRYSQIKAQRLGVERSSMIASLEIATSGLSVATFRDGDTEMPILLRSKQGADSSLSALTTMPVFSSRGKAFPIAQAAAKFDFGYDMPMLRRINSERVMKAQCDPERGVNAIQLLGRLTSEIESRVAIPEGYRMEVYGEQESREESNEALAGELPITLILIFLMLLLLFGNLRDSIVVLVTLPLIFMGVVLGLVATGKMFDFFSLLGLLGLVGMNVKNGVILISRIGELRSSGVEPYRAVITAACDRFIPVVAASMTTVLGMLPLLFDSMFGSMAATIMGGLVVATLLVLMILPVVYSLFYGIRR